jgi:hypothetical protein
VSASSFDTALSQLRSGVDDLFRSKRTLPGFLLLYTSIDILASLTRPEKSEKTNGPLFKAWVTNYMLPMLSVPCNADDLWGARCGLLHTLTAESDMSRGKAAKMLNYIGDDAKAKAMQKQHDPTSSHDIFISTPRFVDAFLAACDRFAADVRADADLQKRVYLHAAKLMVAFD